MAWFPRTGLLILCLLLTGCILQRADVSPEGQLEIFGPSSKFAVNDLPGDWITLGLTDAKLGRQVSISSLDASPAIEVTPADKDFLLIRRISAGLLSSPFVSWSWTRSPGAKERAKVSLIIGFYGGDPKSRSWGSEFFAFVGNKVPPHDRVLALNWGGETELAGTVDKGERTTRVVVRSIRNTGGEWHDENADIGQLYRDAWPKDRPSEAKIMFVGFIATAAGQNAPSPVKFSDVVLYR